MLVAVAAFEAGFVVVAAAIAELIAFVIAANSATAADIVVKIVVVFVALRVFLPTAGGTAAGAEFAVGKSGAVVPGFAVTGHKLTSVAVATGENVSMVVTARSTAVVTAVATTVHPPLLEIQLSQLQ